MSSKSHTKVSFDKLIAVIQYDPAKSGADSLTHVGKLVACAHRNGAQIAYLPENFYTSENFISLQSSSFSDLKERISHKNLWLSLGGFNEKDSSGKIYKSHVLLDNEQNIASVYRKIHLYKDFHKSGTNSSEVYPGEILCSPTNSPIGNQGLALSFDAYFPELSVAYREMYNCHALIFPVSKLENLPSVDKDEWLTVLRTRAVENQCYVISSAQESELCCVMDPWGRQLLSNDNAISEKDVPDGKVYFATISSESLHEVRLNMPMMEHKRGDIFPHTFNVISQQDIGDKDYKFGRHVIPPSTVFYRSKHSFAFVNVSPLVPGHVLVCPVEEVKEFSALTDAQICDLCVSTQLIVKRISDYHGADSYIVAQQDGPAAGQSVPHVHFHLQPRKDGDFGHWENESNKPTNSQPLTEENRKFRSLEEMSKEAAIYRHLFY